MQTHDRASSLLIVLVGPKGAGKTTLGRILQERLGLHFVHVERIAQRVLADCGGVIDERYARLSFHAIIEEIGLAAQGHDRLVMESTGASNATLAFLSALREQHDMRLIRVHASRSTCEARLNARDQTYQVQVPPALVAQMYERSTALSLPWDLEIDNDSALDTDAVIKAVQPLLSRRGDR